MNEKKAKALRRKVYGDQSLRTKREYVMGKPSTPVGNMIMVRRGPRRKYQDVKHGVVRQANPTRLSTRRMQALRARARRRAIRRNLRRWQARVEAYTQILVAIPMRHAQVRAPWHVKLDDANARVEEYKQELEALA